MPRRKPGARTLIGVIARRRYYGLSPRLVRRASCLPSRIAFLMSTPCLTFSLALAMKIAASMPVLIAL